MGWMQISTVNEIRFVPDGFTLPQIYNFIQFDRDWAYNLLYPFQNKRVYKIRKQKNDKNCVQINTDLDNPVIEIRESITNNILYTIAPTSTATISGNEYKGFQLDTYQWLFKLETILPNFTGTCYYVIKADDGGVDRYFVSEPIEVRTKWNNTICLEYTHNRNDYNIIFSLNPRFSIRIDAYLTLQGTDSLDTQFENQDNATVTLKTLTKRKYNLDIGYPKGIPRYMLDKLVNAFACKDIKIEGWKYVKSESVQLEFTQNSATTLFNASIVLEDAIPEDVYTFNSSNVLNLIPANNFPYAFTTAGFIVFPSGSTIDLMGESTHYIINDIDDVLDKMNEWNSAALGLGLDGTFSIINGYLAYTSTYYEYLQPYSQILDSIFEITYNLTAISATTSQLVSNATPIVVDWGDGDNYYPIGASQNVFHTFSNESIEQRTVKFFNKESIVSYSLMNSVDTAKFLSFDNVPTSLEVLNMSFLPASFVTIDLSPLRRASHTLQEMIVTDSSIEEIIDPFFLEASDPDNFKQLKVIDFTSNAITVSSLQTFVSNLVDYANYMFDGSNKSIDMSGQMPPAVPNPAANAKILLLNAAMWTTNFD